MKITEEQMSVMFDELNAEYFDSQLLRPSFRVIHTLDALGLYCRKKLTMEIRMSDVYDRDEHSYKTTMLHEMIHLKIDQFHIKDNADHGKVFMKEARRINAFGWNITPVSDTSKTKINEGTTRKRTVYIFKKDQKVFAVASERGGEHVLESNIRKYGIPEWNKIVTNDPMFAALPSCRVKIIGITLTPEQISYVKEHFNL